MISNAGDDQDVQQLVRRFDISQYFDFILTSAACSYRKPHPRIFELALSNWYFLPSEAVMVGDNLDADIRGAQERRLVRGLDQPPRWSTKRRPAAGPTGRELSVVTRTSRLSRPSSGPVKIPISHHGSHHNDSKQT